MSCTTGSALSAAPFAVGVWKPDCGPPCCSVSVPFRLGGAKRLKDRLLDGRSGVTGTPTTAGGCWTAWCSWCSNKPILWMSICSLASALSAKVLRLSISTLVCLRASSWAAMCWSRCAMADLASRIICCCWPSAWVRRWFAPSTSWVAWRAISSAVLRASWTAVPACALKRCSLSCISEITSFARP